MFTFWHEVDEIKRFADEDVELAYYDFDRALLIELEPKVLHQRLNVGTLIRDFDLIAEVEPKLVLVAVGN
jgi:hypothetical protein